MKHECKISVLATECYEDLQSEYLANVLVSSRAMNFSSSANLTETIFITLVAAREYQMVAIGLVGKRGML